MRTQKVWESYIIYFTISCSTSATAMHDQVLARSLGRGKKKRIAEQVCLSSEDFVLGFATSAPSRMCAWGIPTAREEEERCHVRGESWWEYRLWLGGGYFCAPFSTELGIRMSCSEEGSGLGTGARYLGSGVVPVRVLFESCSSPERGSTRGSARVVFADQFERTLARILLADQLEH